ncbi:MFS general substrate transporter [Annulohypoxylon truncatum]|uniref:MFS general substrate transporter n=1 Tax=Annulohypoxylon truncatum TaxID=327061 RepID=UPI0020076CCA|nr:MFS general substrate transporter [Annulohypoxylon truncatum]KAI1207669.1 MFS general substrate transporter [Annulohypoxylon truncatum]
MASQDRGDQFQEKQGSAMAEPHEDDGGSVASSFDDIPIRRNGTKDEDGIAQRSDTRDVRSTVSEEVRRTTSNVIAHVASRITTRTWPEPPPPPDGGINAWTQVAMGWLVIFTTWGWVNSFGSFQTYYTSVLPQTPSAISWIGSVQIWFCLVISVISGRLLDAGLFLPTFLVGAVIQVLGMFLMSISNQYWSLMLTQGVLTGIGAGIFFTPSLALVATYFNERRGLAVGLATTGNSAGGIIYPVVVRQLIPTLGFAWTTRVLAFINLTCLSIVFAFMRPRLPPRKSGPIIDWSAFRELPYLGVVGGIFATSMSNYFTFYYIASFGRESLGLSYSAASIMVILINGAGIVFRVIPPIIADRIGPINVMFPVTFAWALVAFCWLGVHSVPGLYVFTCFYGICSGSFQCLTATTVASITKRLDTVGTRLGMAFSISSFASLTGPPIGGAIQAASGGKFTGAQAWAASMTFIGFLCFAFVRFNKAGLELKVRC